MISFEKGYHWTFLNQRISVPLRVEQKEVKKDAGVKKSEKSVKVLKWQWIPEVNSGSQTENQVKSEICQHAQEEAVAASRSTALDDKHCERRWQHATTN